MRISRLGELQGAVAACGLLVAIGAGALGCNEDPAASDPSKQTAGNDTTSVGRPGGSATETNVAQVRCDTSDDCAKGVECVFPNGRDNSGVCDVSGHPLGSNADDDAGAIGTR